MIGLKNRDMETTDNGYKKKNPFSVPEGYFDRLPDKVMEQVREQHGPRKVSMVRMMKPYLGLVAIFVLALLVVQFVLPRFVDQNRMLMKEGEQVVVSGNETLPENNTGQDQGFNPTDEEIIEYLETEVNDYELIYAELY